MGTSRRGILKGGVAFLGGLVAAGSGRFPFGRSAARAAVPADGGPATLELHGVGWSVSSRSLQPGRFPRTGDRMTASGTLLDGPAGTPVGAFFGTYMGLHDPGHDGPEGIASLEHHTFRLAEGSIMGTGVGTRHDDEPDTFAIVGGTGRYTGARGSYVATQRHRELGGDGTALITMTIFLEGERHGTG
ncbi:MAG: allene oxide cyclase barrel-like domain-containing protein [Actinomycetota bacterium]